MVPAPAPEAEGPHRVHPRRRRADRRTRARDVLRAGVALLLLTPAGAAPRPAPPADIAWKSARVVASQGRRTADTVDLDVGPGSPVELHLVLEGERDGLPVYCSDFRNFRLDGRAVPNRMVLSPADAGLDDAEVGWVSLVALPDLREWQRTRLGEGDRRWSLPLLEMPGPSPPGIAPSHGTARVAAAIRLPDGRDLRSPGFAPGDGRPDPDSAAGRRVTRDAGPSLVGKASALARLPVSEAAGPAHARARVALPAGGWVAAAIEGVAGGPLELPRTEALDAPAWDWILETVATDVRRRRIPDGPAVGANGRGLPWENALRGVTEGVRLGDIVVTGESVGILSHDDEDGWLDESDRVLHVAHGTLVRTPLAELPGRRATVRRLRDFSGLRARLTAAGYGELGLGAPWDARLERALREFQTDRGLPPTGRPDAATDARLDEFLGRLESPAPAASP